MKDLHLVPNVSGLLVEADLHHHQAPATHPKVDAEEADLQDADLQDHVEALVDPLALLGLT